MIDAPEKKAKMQESYRRSMKAKISQFLLPVAMLATALAVWSCGGASSSSDAPVLIPSGTLIHVWVPRSPGPPPFNSPSVSMPFTLVSNGQGGASIATNGWSTNTPLQAYFTDSERKAVFVSFNAAGSDGTHMHGPIVATTFYNVQFRGTFEVANPSANRKYYTGKSEDFRSEWAWNCSIQGEVAGASVSFATTNHECIIGMTLP